MNPNPDTVGFAFFDRVWMQIDEDGKSPGVGLVIGILFKPGAILIHVQWSANSSEYHYQEELTKEKPTCFTL